MNRILFIRKAHPTVIGGIEGQIIRLSKELAIRKQATPILATSDTHSNFAHQYKQEGFSVFQYNSKNIFTAANDVVNIVKHNNISMIQSHMFYESFIGRLVKWKIPAVTHTFRAHTYIDCSWISEPKKIMYHLIDKLSSKYIDRYIANGAYLAQEIKKRSWIHDKKISVIINGRHSIGEPEQLNNLHSAPFPNTIAMIANIIPHKGFDVLINALEILKKKNIIIHTKIMGSETDAHFSAQLKKEIKRKHLYEQIDFCGFVPDIRSALTGIPVVVLPSDAEGVPNCILEAMSIKKLIVASAVGGVPEIITDGIHGLLHPPQNPAALAAILEKIFAAPANQWNTMRENGYSNWKENFSMNVMTDKFLETYHQYNLGK